MTTYQVDDCVRMTRLFQGAGAFGRWQGQQLVARRISHADLEKRVVRFVQFHHCGRSLTMAQRVALCAHAFDAADDYVAAYRAVRLGDAFLRGAPVHGMVL